MRVLDASGNFFPGTNPVYPNEEDLYTKGLFILRMTQGSLWTTQE